MSELTTTRDHARTMATAEHSPDCAWTYSKYGFLGSFEVTKKPHPDCTGGCISTTDRALWKRIADEIDDYLTTDADPPLWEES